MNNTMMFGKYKATIRFDAEIGEFRGEFLGLNGGADFYGKSLNQWASDVLLEASEARHA